MQCSMSVSRVGLRNSHGAVIFDLLVVENLSLGGAQLALELLPASSHTRSNHKQASKLKQLMHIPHSNHQSPLLALQSRQSMRGIAS